MPEDKCCELMEKKDWEGKTFTWKDRLFVKKKYFSIFYMPLNIDGVLKKLMADLDAKKLMPKEHPIMLFRNEGFFGGEVLVAIKKNDPKYDVVSLSGKYYTKFYEGKSYGEVGKWYKDFSKAAKQNELEVTQMMTEYALCPGCQKKFGKMQAVLFGKLS